MYSIQFFVHILKSLQYSYTTIPFKHNIIDTSIIFFVRNKNFFVPMHDSVHFSYHCIEELMNFCKKKEILLNLSNLWLQYFPQIKIVLSFLKCCIVVVYEILSVYHVLRSLSIIFHISNDLNLLWSVWKRWELKEKRSMFSSIHICRKSISAKSTPFTSFSQHSIKVEKKRWWIDLKENFFYKKKTSFTSSMNVSKYIR